MNELELLVFGITFLMIYLSMESPPLHIVTNFAVEGGNFDNSIFFI